MAGDPVSLPELDDLNNLQKMLEAALESGDFGLAENVAVQQAQLAEALLARAPALPPRAERARLAGLVERAAAARHALRLRIRSVGVLGGSQRRALDGYRRAIAGNRRTQS